MAIGRSNNEETGENVTIKIGGYSMNNIEVAAVFFIPFFVT